MGGVVVALVHGESLFGEGLRVCLQPALKCEWLRKNSYPSKILRLTNPLSLRCFLARRWLKPSYHSDSLHLTMLGIPFPYLKRI